MQTMEVHEAGTLNEQQIASLQTKKIFFGHQSVGADVVQGIRDLMNVDSRLKLKLVTSADPQSTSGPADPRPYLFPCETSRPSGCRYYPLGCRSS